LPDPATEAEVQAIMHDTCAQFGITLRTGWAARVHARLDAAATVAATAMQQARAFLPGRGQA